MVKDDVGKEGWLADRRRSEQEGAKVTACNKAFRHCRLSPPMDPWRGCAQGARGASHHGLHRAKFLYNSWPLQIPIKSPRC